MTTLELNRLRRALKDKQTELDKNANCDWGDFTIEAGADELDLDRKASVLSEVQAALHRMTTGRFGICLGCGEEISSKRLALMPWVASCFACQEAADKEAELLGAVAG